MSSVLFFGKRIPTAKTVWMALQSVKGLGPTLSLQVCVQQVSLVLTDVDSP